MNKNNDIKLKEFQVNFVLAMYSSSLKKLKIRKKNSTKTKVTSES